LRQTAKKFSVRRSTTQNGGTKKRKDGKRKTLYGKLSKLQSSDAHRPYGLHLTQDGEVCIGDTRGDAPQMRKGGEGREGREGKGVWGRKVTIARSDTSKTGGRQMTVEDRSNWGWDGLLGRGIAELGAEDLPAPPMSGAESAGGGDGYRREPQIVLHLPWRRKLSSW
jgi:hypothetical protein